MGGSYVDRSSLIPVLARLLRPQVRQLFPVLLPKGIHSSAQMSNVHFSLDELQNL
jgi:hypothetical protein